MASEGGKEKEEGWRESIGKEKEEGWRESIGKRLGEVEGRGNCVKGVGIKSRKSQMSVEGRGKRADPREEHCPGRRVWGEGRGSIADQRTGRTAEN